MITPPGNITLARARTQSQSQRNRLNTNTVGATTIALCRS